MGGNPAQEVARQKDARTLDRRGDGVVNSLVVSTAAATPMYKPYQAFE